jgi:branched-chain amino acid transport system permease protein
MVYGVLRLINFAHGDIFMFGAFTAYYLMTHWALPLYLVFVITMMVTGGLGFLVEKIAYKPLRNAPKISLLITAVGVSLFLEYFLGLNSLFTSNYIAFPRPFEVIGYEYPLFTITNIQLLIFIITGISLILLYLLIYKTKYGKAMRAVSHDRETASLMGISVDGIISFTFLIGTALAGIGGILYGLPANQCFHGHHAGHQIIHRRCSGRYRPDPRGRNRRDPDRLVGGLCLGLSLFHSA